jgi:hypothetical protein
VIWRQNSGYWRRQITCSAATKLLRRFYLILCDVLNACVSRSAVCLQSLISAYSHAGIAHVSLTALPECTSLYIYFCNMQVVFK